MSASRRGVHLWVSIPGMQHEAGDLNAGYLGVGAVLQACYVVYWRMLQRPQRRRFDARFFFFAFGLGPAAATSVTGGQLLIRTSSPSPFGAHLAAETTSRSMTEQRQALLTLPWFWVRVSVGVRHYRRINIPALKATSRATTYTNFPV
ncbi:hypothetical protein LZ32DRAFT_339478 [Colletotrichum eremochloae]|nr:hypothetical protein LZ32DRAFT_339478 [Colletotrichum eremochloae]